MMDILYYSDLDFSKVKKQFEKTVDFLKNGDFKSAEIKKMQPTSYYRAKLDVENRLLFKFASYEGKNYILLLEVILNHEYEKSRFLKGAEIDETKIKLLLSEKEITKEDLLPLAYVNSKATSFNLLDKAISFDESQELIFHKRPPVIIIGSAGSGKTALTLEKIKLLKGRILYITLSPYLVENSSSLYYSFEYDNEKQEVEFLSFHDFIQSIKVAEGKEIDFKTFENWFTKFRNSFKIKDAHKLFEEFKGVVTGMDISKAFLSREDYEGLGVKQSVFLAEERVEVYSIFEKYLQFLKESNFYDINIISNQWLELVNPIYDFIIIDEVQDLTTVQLHLILKSLKKSENFILCGDSNQIVHPNFFSWSSVKTYLYKNDKKGKEISILKTNYRNAPAVTSLANKLLKIKTSRFGAIDKESTYLVNSISKRSGEVVFLQSNDKIKSELNQNTKGSAKYAVIVMRNEDKAEARKIFRTPLLFSIHEAKGLEYENIILLNFISDYEKEFREISQGVHPDDIREDLEIKFSRGKDKTDKSLDSYKFYIKSLYVAITRAVENLYLLESSPKHDILKLLDLVQTRDKVGIKEQKSSTEDWKNEANKLEKQGKKEQADQIRQSLLKIQPTPWKPLLKEDCPRLKSDALDPGNFNKKAKDLLFDYTLIYHDPEVIEKLADLKYRRAENPDLERNSLIRKYYPHYRSENVKLLTANTDKYGINYRDQFNLTPLLAAVYAGSVNLIRFLKENGADRTAMDNEGKNALQIALNKSHFSPLYASKELGRIYKYILTDSIKVKVDGRMIKIDNHKIEYFLLNYLIALQTALLKKDRWGGGVKMDDFLRTIETYPESVLPYYRKQRSYLSQAVSRNEIDGKEGITKKLFFRVSRGCYVINPELEILVNEDWMNVYDLMGTEKVGKFDQQKYILKAREKMFEDYPEMRKYYK
ncbi:UvrD-helicase domain-containing protein [Aquiflexum sp.]|uniref:UvrD-helicase domain-containing protein n=1 Tax=Aquiflexum sp. TaxID=1872584 RepID=UPI003594707B